MIISKGVAGEGCTFGILRFPLRKQFNGFMTGKDSTADASDQNWTIRRFPPSAGSSGDAQFLRKNQEKNYIRSL